MNWGFIGCGSVTEIKSGPAYSQTDGFKVYGVMRRDFNENPEWHYTFAGVFFLAFTLDVALMMRIDQLLDRDSAHEKCGTCRNRSRVLIGWVTIVSAVATLVAQGVQNRGMMSVCEITFLVAMIGFWATETTRFEGVTISIHIDAGGHVKDLICLHPAAARRLAALASETLE